MCQDIGVGFLLAESGGADVGDARASEMTYDDGSLVGKGPNEATKSLFAHLGQSPWIRQESGDGIESKVSHRVRASKFRRPVLAGTADLYAATSLHRSP